MSRRKEFKGIVNNLVVSLNSRNNHHLGYWAIGQLCSFAEEKGVTTITLSVMENQINPETQKFSALFSSIKHVILTQLKSHKMPEQWLAKAIFSISFNQQADEKIHRFFNRGKPYICQLTLTSDLGRSYTSKSGGYCEPHDPQREQRRGGL
jgi:hypothetical protein